MLTRTLRYGKGYSGKLAAKCWIAAITGTDGKFGLSRDYLEASNVERESFSNPRTIVNMTWELPEGLYEASAEGDRWIFMVTPTKSGEFKSAKLDDSRIKAILTMMDGGSSFHDARIATRPAP